MVKLLLKLEAEPPEATFNNLDDMMAYLDSESPPEPEPKLPTYADKGRILFWFDPSAEDDGEQFEVLDWDGDSAVMWLNEGVGCDYALNEFFDLDIELAGVYVLEDIYGVYYRGSSWGDDDDEEWYCGYLRRASLQEIEGEALDDRN
jgi:hypothetical protein